MCLLRSSVSVFIPTRNRRDMVLRCLSSVYAGTLQPNEVIVFVEKSVDGTEDAVREHFPDAVMLICERELLLAASRNLGLRKSSGDLIFLLDDDNIIDRYTVEKLVSVLDKESRVGVAAPVMYYLSEPRKVWWAGARMSRITGLTHVKYQDRIGEVKGPPYLTQTFHNAWMMKRSMIKRVGLFDEVGFPFFLGEAEYSERMRELGYQALVVPEAKVWHDVPLSSKSVLKSSKAMHIRSPVRAYYVARNRIILLWRYRQSLEFVIFFLVFQPMFFVTQVISILLSGDMRKAVLLRNYVRGFFDAVRMGFRP